MDPVAYHIYGIGQSKDDVHYVGWTSKSASENQEQILSELTMCSNPNVARWVGQAFEEGKISIFEIESVRTIDEAKESVAYWCACFCWLGLDMITGGG